MPALNRVVGRYLFLFLVVLVAWPLAVSAQDQRIDDELGDSSPIVIPLKEALGEVKFNEAINSGEYKYTGNLKCRLCHRDFFKGRKRDPHVHTFKKSIKKKYYNEARCLACHTTGYGVKTGFTSVKKTPKLVNVQCEGCHGPGSKHIENVHDGGFLAGPDRPDLIKKMCHACHNSRWNKSFTDKNFEDVYDAYAAPDIELPVE